MKRIIIAVAITLPLMLVACGGGSSSDPVRDAPEDDQGLPITPPTDNPIETGGDVNAGELASLFGSVAFAYGFAGTEPVFSVEVLFSQANVRTDESGSEILMSVASTSVRLTEGGVVSRGRDMTLGCTLVKNTNQILCVLDSNGESESLFLFDKPVNGTMIGNFEFCSQSDNDCSSKVLFAPDGIVAIAVFPLGSPFAISSNKADKADKADSMELLPYLQYLNQGSENSNSTGIAHDADDRLDDLVNAITIIETLATEK